MVEYRDQIRLSPPTSYHKQSLGKVTHIVKRLDTTSTLELTTLTLRNEVPIARLDNIIKRSTEPMNNLSLLKLPKLEINYHRYPRCLIRDNPTST